jgi:Tol biopolymer transport system component
MGELDIPSTTLTFYLDSSYAVSSCVYMPNSTRYIYFYTFGSYHLRAGYYLFDKESMKSSLIFNYASDIRLSMFSGEYIHGFDISPDGKKLLYPVSMKGSYPLMVEYDIMSKIHDTLDIVFERKREQQCMWLRYSPDGKKILYCCYPEYAYDHTNHYPESNEVGVYDKEKKRKVIVPVSTNTELGSISIYPVWSSDGKHLLYGSGRCSTDDRIGIFFPYIFENVAEYIGSH